MSKARINVEKLNNIISVVDYGAVGNGTTDDTAAFQAAIDAAAALKGGTVVFYGRHLIDSNLTVKDYVSLQGPLGLADELLPGSSADYDAQKGVLVVNSAATISVADGASLSHCLIIRKGLNLPFADATAALAGVAAFAGTAISVSGAGSYLHHLLILGFNKAIASSSFERTRCEYVQGDCTNGIDLATVYDIAYVENCHFWPWTTTHQSWTTGATNKRSGTAYKFSAVGDWSKLTNCFSYAYETGFLIDSCDHVNLIGCGADHYGPDVNTTSRGFAIEGTSRNALLLGCQAAAQATGVEIKTTASTGGSARIIGCNFWANDSSAITITSGRALIEGCEFETNATAINVNATSNGVYAVGNDFDSDLTPITISGAAARKSSFNGNRFFNCSDSLGNQFVRDGGLISQTMTAAASAANGFRITGRTSRGTLTSPTIAQADDLTISLRGQIYDGSAYGDVGQIRFQAAGTPGAGSTEGVCVFSTTPSASSSAVDRFALFGNGNIAPLVDDVYTNGINGGRWAAVWAANGTIQTSDERTKTDIADAVLGLNFVNSLRPVSYKFKIGGRKIIRQVYRNADGEECNPADEGSIPSEIITEPVTGTRTHWGLIAQEVKASCDAANVDFGGWLLTDKDNPDSEQALRYDQFIAPILKAIQELSNRIVALENANAP